MNTSEKTSYYFFQYIFSLKANLLCLSDCYLDHAVMRHKVFSHYSFSY